MTEVISHVALRVPVEEGGSWRRLGSCTHMSELFADRHTLQHQSKLSYLCVLKWGKRARQVQGRKNMGCKFNSIFSSVSEDGGVPSNPFVFQYLHMKCLSNGVR